MITYVIAVILSQIWPLPWPTLGSSQILKIEIWSIPISMCLFFLNTYPPVLQLTWRHNVVIKTRWQLLFNGLWHLLCLWMQQKYATHFAVQKHIQAFICQKIL